MKLETMNIETLNDGYYAEIRISDDKGEIIIKKKIFKTKTNFIDYVKKEEYLKEDIK